MILTGLARLGADVEVRYTTGGDPVANLSLAYNYGRKDQDGKRPTQWVEATLWGDRATALQQYLTKGTALDVVIEDVHVKTFKRLDGSQGEEIAGRVTLLEFAGGKRNDEAAAVKTEPEKRVLADPPPVRGTFDDFEGDIPF